MWLPSAAILLVLVVGAKGSGFNISQSNVTAVRRLRSTVSSGVTTAAATTTNGKCRFVKDKCVPGEETHRHSSFLDRNCYCDSACTEYDDCCSNFETVQEATGMYYQYERNKRPKLFDCVFVHGKLQFATFPNIYMFNKCPPSWKDEETRRLCELSGDLVGVNLSTISNGWLHSSDQGQQFHANLGWLASGRQSRRTYRNYFCAKCHGEADALLWPITINCLHRESNSSEKHSLNMSAIDSFAQLVRFSTECHSLLRMPFPDDVTYCHRVIDTCAQDAAGESVRRCHEGAHSYVFAHNVPERFRNETRMRSEFETLSAFVFKNEACARCNWLNASDTEKCHTAMSIQSNSAQFKPLAFSFAALFEPRRPGTIQVKAQTGGSSQSVEKSFDVTCPAGTVFVPIVLSCIARNNSLNGSGDYLAIVEMQEYEEGCDANVETSITVSLLIASCLALLVHIVVYSLFRALRNVQGQLVLCFSVNLSAVYLIIFLALIPQTGTWLCKLTAIACHFALLSIFFWMQALIFDVWQTILSNSLNRLSLGSNEECKHRRKLIRYCLYCYGCPLLVVMLAVVLELSDGQHVKPLYGISGNCWLSAGQGRLFFFTVPVTLVVCSTCLLLLSICVRVWRIAGETNSVLRKVNTSVKKTASNNTLAHQTSCTTGSEISVRKQVFLFAKLCVLGGLLWLLGVLYELTGSCVFNYLFTLCCASQGLAVALMFLCTRKVLKLLRRRFAGKAASTASQQPSNTGLSRQTQSNLNLNYSTNVHRRTLLRKSRSIPGNFCNLTDLDLHKQITLDAAQLHAAKSTSYLHRTLDENSIIQHQNRQNIARFIDEKIDFYKFGAKAAPIHTECNVQHESVRHKGESAVQVRNNVNKNNRQCNTVS